MLHITYSYHSQHVDVHTHTHTHTTEAYVSLATNDSYATGAIALGRSLRDSGTTRRLALLITNNVSSDMR